MITPRALVRALPLRLVAASLAVLCVALLAALAPPVVTLAVLCAAGWAAAAIALGFAVRFQEDAARWRGIADRISTGGVTGRDATGGPLRLVKGGRS